VARVEANYDLRVADMLRQLSKEVSDCYAHAEVCARKAAEATADQSREDYLRVQRHWLTLARSYEFGERLRDFSKENNRRRAEFYGYDISVDVGSRCSALAPVSAEEETESIRKLLKEIPNGSAITFGADQLGALCPNNFAYQRDDYTRVVQRLANACHCVIDINVNARTATFTKALLSESALRSGIARVSQAPAAILSESIITAKNRPIPRLVSAVVLTIALCGAAAAAVLWKAGGQQTLLAGQSATKVVASVSPTSLVSADSAPQSGSTGHDQPENRVTRVGATSLPADTRKSSPELRAPDKSPSIGPSKEAKAAEATRVSNQKVAKHQLAAPSNRNSVGNSADTILFKPWWYSWR